VILRADKGFYDHGLVEWLEAGQAGFVVVARLTGPIKRRLAHLRYTSPSRGVEVAEFRYQPTRWRRSYRCVVIRRPQPEEPTEQLTLFKLGRYHYQVLVTKLPLQPLNLWRGEELSGCQPPGQARAGWPSTGKGCCRWWSWLSGPIWPWKSWST
jgi:hypothetical protein